MRSLNALFAIKSTALLPIALLTLAALPARANLFSLAASGTISENSSGDATIPVGTAWSFQIIYDTAAPDLDFESGPPDPTFGRYANTASPPAMTFFHYKAGTYEVTLNNAADFGMFSGIEITNTSIKGIDINLNAPTLFPHLGGGIVGFHADFAAVSSPPIFTSDALPTNTAIGPGSFVDSNITLLPPVGVVTGSGLTSFSITAVPQHSGDYNNGIVDAADYTVWRDHLGQSFSLPNRDPNATGPVAASDYTFWVAHFGQTGAGAASVAQTAVPEPASLCMLLAGILLTCRRFAIVS